VFLENQVPAHFTITNTTSNVSTPTTSSGYLSYESFIHVLNRWAGFEDQCYHSEEKDNKGDERKGEVEQDKMRGCQSVKGTLMFIFSASKFKLTGQKEKCTFLILSDMVSNNFPSLNAYFFYTIDAWLSSHPSALHFWVTTYTNFTLAVSVTDFLYRLSLYLPQPASKKVPSAANLSRIARGVVGVESSKEGGKKHEGRGSGEIEEDVMMESSAQYEAMTVDWLQRQLILVSSSSSTSVASSSVKKRGPETSKERARADQSLVELVEMWDLQIRNLHHLHQLQQQQEEHQQQPESNMEYVSVNVNSTNHSKINDTDLNSSPTLPPSKSFIQQNQISPTPLPFQDSTTTTDHHTHHLRQLQLQKAQQRTRKLRFILILCVCLCILFLVVAGVILVLYLRGTGFN
jgi:uncharacterized membrane protein